MIDQIEWDRFKSSFNELPSPFMRGMGERPLRITLHSETLTDVSDREKTTIELIRELANLPELEIFETGGQGDFPHIVVGEPSSEDDFIPVQLFHGDTLQLRTLVWNKRQWPLIAAHLVGTTENSEEKLNLLILAQAHRSVRGDILITKSPFLLSNRNQGSVSEANPRTPSEAAQLIGLFLRSRNNYTIQARTNFKNCFDRWLFYWVLARYHLPSMWRYFSACMHSRATRGDDIQELGESILVRTVRALEARDTIGIQFYIPQNKDTEDQMLYHFDYLTLLLSGAFDAQARVANRAYHPKGVKEQYATFRRPQFREALANSGARELYELSSSEKFNNLLTLLYEPRNTIHGAALKTVTYQRGSAQHTYIEITQDAGQKLLEAGRQLGGAKEWGLISEFDRIWLEPYSYASALVKESLNAINSVAAATDVTRLFQSQPIPSLAEEAPKDPVFAWGERISVLA
ncbi:MAG: hypothetical protein V1767_09820 [Chloroflexota bacterium]